MQREIEVLLHEVVSMQKNKLLKLARDIIPNATPDDILQPNDFLELENSPFFRYEEGVLHGMQALEAALRALFAKEKTR